MCRRRLAIAVALAVLVALLAAVGAGAKPQVIRFGNLILRDNGGITPTKLPRDRRAAIAAHIDVRIGTSDGSHPPAVESLSFEFDRSLRVDAEGLPVCGLGRILARPSDSARAACPEAIVGSGSGEVEVAFPEQAPFIGRGPIVLFNGGVRGGTTVVYIHTYLAVPAPTAVIAVAELTRVNHGRYGIQSVSEIPEIAGGAGSVTKFRLTVNRRFTHRGKERSYLNASCPTGVHYTRARIQLVGGALLRGAHRFPCTPTR
jgi:hypothetical protein